MLFWGGWQEGLSVTKRYIFIPLIDQEEDFLLTVLTFVSLFYLLNAFQMKSTSYEILALQTIHTIQPQNRFPPSAFEHLVSKVSLNPQNTRGGDAKHEV